MHVPLPTGHSRVTIYWITVQDVNDVPPVFDRSLGVYEVQLPESREVGKPTGIRLAVDDADEGKLLLAYGHNHVLCDYQLSPCRKEFKFHRDRSGNAGTSHSPHPIPLLKGGGGSHCLLSVWRIGEACIARAAEKHFCANISTDL